MIADQQVDPPQEQAPERASAGQAVEGDLQALLSDATALAGEIEQAMAARTPREVYLDHLAERVLPLSLKDTPPGHVARRLAGYERQTVRLLREADALREQWERSHRRVLELGKQWQALAARQEALIEWLDELADGSALLGDWTRRVVAYQQRRLEDLEAGDLLGAPDAELR
jgi:hypothetical protein